MQRERDEEMYESEYHSTSANSPILCSRCRAPTNDQSNDLNSGQSPLRRIGSNSNGCPEVILVAQTAAAELTKILNTLNLGLSTVRRGFNHVSRSSM
jgi:hypothetical protein